MALRSDAIGLGSGASGKAAAPGFPPQRSPAPLAGAGEQHLRHGEVDRGQIGQAKHRRAIEFRDELQARLDLADSA